MSEIRAREIRMLEEECRQYDGTEAEAYLSNDMNFRKSFRCFYLYYIDNVLVGFLGMYAPVYPEVEISAFVKPALRRKGIFDRMLEEAMYELESWGIDDVIFKIETESGDGLCVAEKLALNLKCSELLMKLDSIKFRCKYENDRYRLIEEEGIKDRVDNESEVRHFLLAESRGTKASKVSGTDDKAEICGELFFSIGDRTIFIFDVKIEENKRGKGLGTIMVELALEYIMNEYPDRDIKLHVTDTNYPAYKIYKKYGFEVEKEIRCYTVKP